MFDEDSMSIASFDITSLLFAFIEGTSDLIRYPWAFLTKRRLR